MKFIDNTQKKLFLVDVGRVDLLKDVDDEWQPDDDLIELFIKRNRSFIPKLKSFRKKQQAKDSWRKNRYKFMKGIRTFHKSTQGKRFHRNLGNFLATRDSLKSSVRETVESLKALSSAKTHLLEELNYYHSLTDRLDFQMFLEEALPVFQSLESTLLKNEFLYESEDLGFLIRIINKNNIIKSYSDKVGIKFEVVEQHYDDVFRGIRKDGLYEAECSNLYQLFLKFEETLK